MKHIAVGLDFDGCLISRAYIYPFEPKRIGDIKTNTSIIDINLELWAFISKLCKNNPDLEKLTLLHFSARQCAGTDAFNSNKHGTESYFLAMTKIANHLTKLLKTAAPHVTLELNRLLMPDIYRDKNEGDTHQTALDDIDYSIEGKGIISMKLKHHSFMPDDSKITLVFAHVHAVTADAFYYIDDRIDILRTIERFFSDSIGATFIPQDTKVNLHLYYEGEFQDYKKEIAGTGDRQPYYADILRRFFTKAYYDPHLLPSISAFTHEQSIHMFDLIVKKINEAKSDNYNFIIENYLPIFGKQPPEAVSPKETSVQKHYVIS